VAVIPVDERPIMRDWIDRFNGSVVTLAE
jgi:hypothetical protein